MMNRRWEPFYHWGLMRNPMGDVELHVPRSNPRSGTATTSLGSQTWQSRLVKPRTLED